MTLIMQFLNTKHKSKKTFMYNGEKLWNKLPNSLKVTDVNENLKNKYNVLSV